MIDKTFLLIVNLLTLHGIPNSYGHIDTSFQTYVVDNRFPLIFSYKDETSTKSSHFGATVAFSPRSQVFYKRRPLSWIFIGAPKANSSLFQNENEPGVLWKCSIGRGLEKGSEIQQEEEYCKVVDMDKPTKGRRGGVRPESEQFEGMWTGGSLLIKDGRLVTCGHRYSRGNGKYMNGICYWYLDKPDNSDMSYLSEDGPLSETDYHSLLPFFVNEGEGKSKNVKEQNFNFTLKNGKIEGRQEWGTGQVGTSLSILTNQSGGHELLLGAPGTRIWSGAIVKYIDNPSKNFSPNFRRNRDINSSIYSEFVVLNRGTQKLAEDNHWYDYFGYAVTSGRYFETDKVVYVGGSPRGFELSGEVVIFREPQHQKSREEIYKRQIEPVIVINPPEDSFFGSYFGSVLHSVDIDGDGREELLVGAPMTFLQQGTRRKRATDFGISGEGDKWTGEHGCVFVYYFNSNETIVKGGAQILQPDFQASGSRFGTAISHLKWEDSVTGNYATYIVIGAPFENEGQGAIYFYRKVKDDLKLTQKVYGEQISEKIKAFGSSISLPLDVDQNETPDIAVGAFESGQVTILRTRPNVTLIGNVVFVDPKRNLNDGKILKESDKITLKSCIVLKEGVGKVSDLDVRVLLTFDKRLTLQGNLNGLEKVLNHTFAYIQRVSPHRLQQTARCQNFSVVIEKVKNALPFYVTQTIMYNETRKDETMMQTDPLDLEIDSRGKVIKLNKTKNGIEFRDFRPNLPYPISKISKKFISEIAPNDCMGRICKPNLQIAMTWNTLDDAKAKEIVLGTLDEITLKIYISNLNETAISPEISVEWPKNGISVKPGARFILEKEYCKENHNQQRMVYNCKFPEDITKESPKMLEIPFSLKDVYATKQIEEFTVDFSIKPEDSDERKFHSSSLVLKTKSRLYLFGSRESGSLRNPEEHEISSFKENKTTLYAPFRQNYRVHVRGKSNLQTRVMISFPHEVKIKGSSKVLFLTSATSDNSYCKSDALYEVSLPSADRNDEINVPDLLPPSVLFRTKRDVEEKFPEISKGSNFTTENALILSCDSLSPEINCVQITCNLQIRGESFIELGFHVYAVKEEIDKLLTSQNKDTFLVQSQGQSTSFDGQYNDYDVAQTYFLKLTTPVGIWVYLVSSISGLLLLLLIVFILYKCGFFKRDTKEQLKFLKAEARKSMLVRNSSLHPNPNEEMMDNINIESTDENSMKQKPITKL